MTDTRVLLVERRDQIGLLTINRPERRNALTPDILLQLHETLEQWAREDAVRVVILRGAGDRAFSSGYDITAIPTNITPEIEAQLREHNPLELGLGSVKQFPYPTIAMLNGHCFGASLNLALCCDIRIGADDIAVGMPPAKLGLVYPADGVAQFVQVIGMPRAREAFFTGRTYKGADVKRMGLVDHQVPRAELEATVFGLADEMAANAPLSLRGLKRILNLVEQAMAPTAEARAESEALMAAAFSSEDLIEGQSAFLEKRPPRFVGR